MASKRKESFQDFTGNSNAGGTSLNLAYSGNSSLNSLVSSTGTGSQVQNSFNNSGSNFGFNNYGYNNYGGSNVGAYNSSGTNSYDTSPEPKGNSSGFGSNIWGFLGIDELSLKKKQCVYNCGIDLLGCMERCASPDCRQQDNVNKEQCRYGCMRKGITCSTACISEIETDSKNNENNLPLFNNEVEQNLVNPTDQVEFNTINGINSMNNINSMGGLNNIGDFDMNGFNSFSENNMSFNTMGENNMSINNTIGENNMSINNTIGENNMSINNTIGENTNSNNKEITPQEACKKHYDILPNEVVGVYSALDNFSPYDMRVWPKEGKYGWTLSEINKMKRNGYDSPDVIEVNMNHSLYPILTDKPEEVFDYAS
jgi:hypothetical protein